MLTAVREFTSYEAPDGAVYDLHVPSARWVINQSGWGTPPIEYITERPALTDGALVKDFFLQPRLIQMLVRQNFCDRLAYWEGRAGILDAIRPNRQLLPAATAPGRLCRLLPDGAKRCLDVYLTEGPRFEPRQVGRWDEFAFQEVLRFIAYDPVVYDPVEQCVATTAGTGELVFPITFPITFGGFASIAPIQYDGTWAEYPIITLAGPILGPGVENGTTGEQITLSYSIASGETVTIDLRPGQKTVTSDIAGNIIGSVTSGSDLATWHLAPNPEAPNGVNQIAVVGSGLSPTSAVTICWLNRYFGV